VASAKESLRSIGESLLFLQVNLIVASGGMSAEPMPEPPDALQQLGTWYSEFLELPATVPTTPARLRELSTTAKAQSSRPGSNMARCRILWRIEAYSLKLADAAERNASQPRWTPEDVTTLRKAWELGTDEVALQTTIQIDGDVVTRVDPAFLGEAHTRLREMHQDGVESSMRSWQNLVDTAVRLVGGVIGSVRR
jgi:hypothetical protein